MTSNQFYQRQRFNQIVKPVSVLRFRFKGCSHWWTEYFDCSPYQLTLGEFRSALAPFCELEQVQL